MTATQARDRSIRLAPDQPEQALSLAREIKEPWFKCQALSWAGRYWPDGKYDRILEEAIASADLQPDPYQQVAVSAWPIRAYLERGNSPPARKHLARYASASRGIENMGSRSEALFHIFQASRPFDPDLWQPVFWALVREAEPTLSWRQRRNLRDAVIMVTNDHPKLVQDALQKLSDQKNLSAIHRWLERSDMRSMTPRSFFWPNAR